MPAVDIGAPGVSSTGPAVDARLLDEAANWLARWYAPDFSVQERVALEQWRQQSPAHAHVWESAQRLGARMGTVPPAVGMAVLGRRRAVPPRRTVLRALAWAVAAPGAAWLAHQAYVAQNFGAQYRTAVGERRSIALTDGSVVALNTRSAMTVAFDADTRAVWHQGGELLVQTAPDPGPLNRPFVVHCAHGSMRALGTRFGVRQEAGATQLTVLEGAVELTLADVPQSTRVRAGQQMRFTATTLEAAAPTPLGADAWTHGVLYAEEMRLQDFVAELARYRPGVLRCDPAVAQLRVSGAFQLDDTDRVLQLLAQTLPIRVSMRTPYWVVLAPR